MRKIYCFWFITRLIYLFFSIWFLFPFSFFFDAILFIVFFPLAFPINPQQTAPAPFLLLGNQKFLFFVSQIFFAIFCGNIKQNFFSFSEGWLFKFFFLFLYMPWRLFNLFMQYHSGDIGIRAFSQKTLASRMTNIALFCLLRRNSVILNIKTPRTCRFEGNFAPIIWCGRLPSKLCLSFDLFFWWWRCHFRMKFHNISILIISNEIIFKTGCSIDNYRNDTINWTDYDEFRKRN